MKKKRFGKIIQENLDGLWKLAYMKCQNKEIAEDLVQDTCAKAYKYFLKTGEIIENPKGWLSKILLNTHIDYTRKKYFESVDINKIEITDSKNLSEEVETNIFFGELHKVLKELKPEQREIIVLKDIEEHSYKEISELLNILLGTVMSRLHTARQILRKLLTEKGYSKEEIKKKEEQTY
ncbi:MAG: RNA polymerase sigma factor [Candidatus Melainabacteria bacterium]|nr:RNA polymerase sigma factor [Candidatus Melainabacteria bacterium]